MVGVLPTSRSFSGVFLLSRKGKIGMKAEKMTRELKRIFFSFASFPHCGAPPPRRLECVEEDASKNDDEGGECTEVMTKRELYCPVLSCTVHISVTVLLLGYIPTV